MKNRLLYALVFLSGCSGLIYEVVWHKYLAILLGAQARATAIVLAIFLGGISAGYAAFGRWSRWKPWNLLLAYSLVELGLAVWAFLFPTFFKLAMPLTSSLYRWLGVSNIAIDFFVAILLIGFPTFLMGGTLPLLTQGLSKGMGDASRTHARIYGFNTIGACFGSLLAGYFLIPTTTLGFTTLVGGVFNLLVALIAYFVYAKRSGRQAVAAASTEEKAKRPFSRTQLVILGVGFLSGFYLITLQTVLIRLMGLATGAANYNFTLIVSIFILCLGFGSLRARGIDGYSLERLFWNQVIVTISLFALYLTGDYWSYGVHVLRATLRDIPENFFFFQFLLGGGFLALLAIPLGFSGLTLPLCFHLIKDRKESLGLRVGQLYGLNTLGCVLGALIGGYALLDYFDLDQLFKFCVFLGGFSALAAGYLCLPAGRLTQVQQFGAGGVIAVSLAGAFFAPLYSHDRFIQPFRHPSPTQATFAGAEAFGRYLGRSTEFVYWKDGPNTSLGVGVSKYQGKEISRTIFVNGKSDGNTRGDLFTTVMLAHIPALLSEKTERACIIGFGTGMTIGTLAQYPSVKEIDVVEISNTILKNASYFDAYNFGVSTNPKVKFNEMDAFRFLGGTTKKYDIVISEPSNPWVAGIENLYSEEFYDMAKSKLEVDGMFVQWIHTYSFHDDLLKMVLRTMATRFPYVSVFQLKGGDLAFVGKQRPFVRADAIRAQERIQSAPITRQALFDAGVKRLETMLALEIISPPLARVLSEGDGIHSLESPRLSNEAAKAFFVGASSKVQTLRRLRKEYYPAIDSSLLATYLGETALPWEAIESLRTTFCENPVSKSGFLCEESMAMSKLARSNYEPDRSYEEIASTREIAGLSDYHEPIGKKFSGTDLTKVYRMFEAYKKYASPIARFPINQISNALEDCLKTTALADELHGECLLQKILVLETVRLPGPELTATVNSYLDWFPKLATTAPNYAKLEEARNILVKMAAQRN